MDEAGIGEMAARVDKKETSAKVKLRLELNVQLYEVILLASPKTETLGKGFDTF